MPAEFTLLGLIFNLPGTAISLVGAFFFFGQIGDRLVQHRRVRRWKQWLTASVLCAIAAHLVPVPRR